MDDKKPDDDGKERYEPKEGESFDKDGNLFIKLTIDDSALVVRADGMIEMISHELQKAEGGYVGDIEDLNKTFSLVLALTSALENEDLYNRIYHNLNMVLMNKWEKIPDEIKREIVDKRRNTAINRTDEEREDKNRRVDEFRDRMNKYKNGFLDQERKRLAEDIDREAEFYENLGEDFADPHEVQRHMEDMLNDHRPKPQPKRLKRTKRNPLLKLTGMDWNPNHSTLEVKRVDGRYSPFKSQYRLDEPPEDEE